MKISKTNKYFYITIAISAIVIIITGVQGVLQISERKADYEKYIQANTSLKNMQNPEKKEMEKIIKELDELNEKYKDVPNLYMDKANAYYKISDYKKSLEQLNKYFAMEETKKDNPTIMYLYGKIAYLSGDTTQAKNAMNKAVELGILNENISDADKNFVEKVIKE